MNKYVSRREALANIALAACAFSIATVREARAADLPHLSEKDPLAVALSYHEEVKTVKAAAFPTFKPEQKCSTCAQAKGKAGDAWRPCALFPSNTVNANGWCKVWVKQA